MKQKTAVLISFCLLIAFPLVIMAGEGPASASSIVNSSPTDVSGSLLKVTFGLLFVVAAIFASAWFFRRFSSMSSVPSDSLKIIGGLNIGNREKVILVQVGKEQVLIGVTPSNINTLHILSENIQATNGQPANQNFSEKFNQALKQWKTKQ